MKNMTPRYFFLFALPAVGLTACGPNVKTYPSHAEPKVFALGMKFRPVTIKGGPTDGKVLLFCIHETRRQDYEVFFADPKRDRYLAKYTAGPASEQWKVPTGTEHDSTGRKPTGRRLPRAG